MSAARPILDDIARLAGVSKATASKALAVVPGRYRISPATTERIRAVARDLGWTRPVAESKGRIALVHGDHLPLLDGINGPLHNALVNRTIQRGLEVIYQSMDRGSRDGRARTLSRADGCLFIMRMPLYRRSWDVWLEEIQRFPPVVLINAGLDLPLPHVAPDDAGGAADLMHHIADAGHRSVALCGPLRHPTQQHHSHERRHRSLSSTARECNVTLTDWCDRPYTQVASDLRRTGKERPTALIDLSGWGLPKLTTSLLRAGLDWPRDIALAVCDDPPITREFKPAITGVSWSMELLVNEAFRLLEDSIAGRADPVRVLVPERVEIRASTNGKSL